ncbi:MAG: hypothetical protein APF81_25030 [Desulfosporosinus sp. BRH_c37]|nr:MAG: hypothetical protein APF81_25030 [Desulfosporosinus sp. BRH_c37]
MTGELQAVTRHILNWHGFNKCQKILDIGGSFGLFSLALCQENAHLEALIIEEPQRAPYTEKLIKDQGLKDRVKVQVGSILEMDLESNYDVILMAHKLYSYHSQLSSMFTKMSCLLKPGGLLVSNHWFCGPACEVETNGIKDLQKAIHSLGHPICHVEEFGLFFSETGFELLNMVDVPSAYGVSKLHLGQKEG